MINVRIVDTRMLHECLNQLFELTCSNILLPKDENMWHLRLYGVALPSTSNSFTEELIEVSPYYC